MKKAVVKKIKSLFLWGFAFFGMLVFILGIFLYIISPGRLERSNIFPQDVIALAKKESLIGKRVTLEQLNILEKIYSENSKNLSGNNIIFLREAIGYRIRKEVKKNFSLYWASKFPKNERGFGTEVYSLIFPRNSFLKNKEYTLWVNHWGDNKKISVSIVRKCCVNPLMAVINQRNWLNVE